MGTMQSADLDLVHLADPAQPGEQGYRRRIDPTQ